MSQHPPSQRESSITEMRLARLSVLQELTVAALQLTNPRTSVDSFLERVSERMGCVATVWLARRSDNSCSELLAATGISRPARALVIEPTDGPLGEARIPYPEVMQPGVVRWSLPLGNIDDRQHCLLLFMWRPSTDSGPSLERMARRVADIFQSAIIHRQLYLDLQQSYDRLAETQRTLVVRERLAALGEMAAVVAHEVRNPLGAIFNSVATLNKLVPEEPTQIRDLLSVVGEEASRLNRITMDLLQFARPGGANLHETHIAGVIDATVDAVNTAGMFPEDIELVVRVEDDLPMVYLDGRLMRQALLNLLDNAVQASPRPGRVELRASLRRDSQNTELCLSITDNGTGVAQEARDSIFEPFYTTRRTGSGLGLPIVKRIIEAHHGRVLVELSSTGGTVFSLLLPFEPEGQ